MKDVDVIRRVREYLVSAEERIPTLWPFHETQLRPFLDDLESECADTVEPKPFLSDLTRLREIAKVAESMRDVMIALMRSVPMPNYDYDRCAELTVKLDALKGESHEV